MAPANLFARRTYNRASYWCAGLLGGMVPSGANDPAILPFPPGGPADVMTRLLTQQIGASGGPAMVVESHPGAGTEIGTEYAAQAAPDGNTLLIISPSFVVLPHVRKLNYNPLTDFVPICELATFPPLIVVNSDLLITRLPISLLQRIRGPAL